MALTPTVPHDPAAPVSQLRSTRLALAQARVSAAEVRRESLRLCERAQAAARTAAASRDLVDTHRALWAEWHAGWAALRRRPGVGPMSRRLLSVCAYCGAAALPDPGGAVAWRPVPPAVRDGWRDGTLGMLPSHGACPGCAASRLEA